jgi:hypothetical protein
MDIDHFLPHLIPERDQLPAKLIEAEWCVGNIFLGCRDRGRWRNGVHGIRRQLHPLCHVPKFVDAALGES